MGWTWFEWVCKDLQRGSLLPSVDSFNCWVTVQGNYSLEMLSSEGTNIGLEGSWFILRRSIVVKSNTDPIPHCSFLSRHVPVIHALTVIPP